MTDFCKDEGLQNPENLLTLLRSFRDPIQQLVATGKAVQFSDIGFTKERLIIDDFVFNMGNIRRVIIDARKVRGASYAPYSNFNVGAAILTPNTIVRGCNVENSSYRATSCAENTATVKAVSDGERKFNLIGIVGGFDHSIDPNIRETAAQEFIFPCGCCRQVLYEFGGKNLGIVLAKDNDEIFFSLLNYLLPGPFGPESMGIDASEYSRHNPPKVKA